VFEEKEENKRNKEVFETVQALDRYVLVNKKERQKTGKQGASLWGLQ
jgi:hypothetical protein